ncbi:hypothetical protein V5O48_007939 [Marasmius crinis-equi]|uniref:Transmembrane protein n=1 Tax=Marasmius crinis-equi TaxID=585013 RepID=A0ABR3FFB2_9AGAR
MAVVFPSVGLQVLSSLIYFLGLSILAHCLSRRVLNTWTTSLKEISWPRLLVLLVFLDSWLFVFSSGILIFGVGLETSMQACTTAIAICIVFYGSSKILIYLFLVEKVYLVWSPTAEVGSRLRSPVYLVCMATMLGYVAVIILMILGPIHFWRDDGTCIIGLKAFSSIPLLAFDLYITIFLNALFLWPLFRSKIANPRLRKVAIRTLVASLAALITSSINIGVLTVQHGRQLGWVCLGSCGTDVVLNALAVFWVTRGTDNHWSGGNDETVHVSNVGTRSESQPQVRPGSSKSNTKVVAFSSPPRLFRGKRQTPESRALQVMVTTRTSMEVDHDDRESDRQSDVKAQGAEGQGEP